MPRITVGTENSPEAWQAGFNVAAGASPYATVVCVDSWLTSAATCSKIDLPVLVVHGTGDRILPFEATAARLPELIDDVKGRRGRERPAQHRLDPPRESQRGRPRLRRREGPRDGLAVPGWRRG